MFSTTPRPTRSRLMRRRFAHLVVAVGFAATSPCHAAFAQYCIGTTAYVIRDEAGAIMSTEQLERLSVRINGVQTIARTDSVAHRRFLEYETVVARKGYVAGAARWIDSLTTARATWVTNPLTFGVNGSLTACGQLGDLTITSGGQVMRLLFDIREHNTYFEIDGLPFRDGTFHLASLKCADGARPPAVDNASSAKCLVPADRWEGMDADWVRYVIPRPMHGIAGSTTVPPEQCRTRTLAAVTERAASDSLLAAYPSLAQGLWTGVDFRVQFLLAVHQTIGTTYSLRSFRVDKQGDLTYEPPPARPDLSGSCTAMYVVLYRSGIRSIDGIPLPPAPASP